ncbi:hypothetical protein [Streptomyces gobiensis]|uniref:hypothetical protein n=1 Tax=Streptomyces gobiensis TaxID=2875706 RepID=UPI001E367B0C|nr:hypothetical protein [Streptomyces gobiensis]UGY94589.1 hypothetical protein test1122_24550 [Streptomyces gobiensis]
MGDALYVRFQGTRRNQRGDFPGVFVLVNGLARDGKLTDGQERFRRANNDWYDASYPNPAHVDPTVYDHTVNPGAAAWFKSSARALLDRVDGYLEILAAHGVECERLRSADPGKIVYEDEYQIVVIPHPSEACGPVRHDVKVPSPTRPDNVRWCPARRCGSRYPT